MTTVIELVGNEGDVPERVSPELRALVSSVGNACHGHVSGLVMSALLTVLADAVAAGNPCKQDIGCICADFAIALARAVASNMAETRGSGSTH